MLTELAQLEERSAFSGVVVGSSPIFGVISLLNLFVIVHCPQPSQESHFCFVADTLQLDTRQLYVDISTSRRTAQTVHEESGLLQYGEVRVPNKSLGHFPFL